MAALLYLVEIVATLATPVAINFLLVWTEDPSGGVAAGVASVVGLGVAATTAFVADYASERVAKSAGAICRMAACGALYDKMLRMTAVDAQRTNSGELLSLFGTDADAFLDLWHGTVGLALQPLEILGNIGLLFLYVRLAAFGGLGVVLTALAITHVCGGVVERLSVERSQIADLRIRDVYEMLLGIKVVKYNSWEPRFASVLLQRRREESAVSRRIGRYLAVVNTISSNSVDIISLAVILLYVIALDNRISPAIVFTFWVVLGLLHAKIFHFPIALKHCKEGVAAATRLDRFLSQPERAAAPLEGPVQRSESAGGPPSTGGATAKDVPAAVVMQRASFSWQATVAPRPGDGSKPGPTAVAPAASPSDPAANPAAGRRSSSESVHAASDVLQDVSLSVRQGELLAVAGMVGSGKSTLLASLLGETTRTGGSCSLNLSAGPDEPLPASGSAAAPISYVPQSAWIIAGTVRDNILFGRPYDAARYAAVVHACALEHDFALWPQGDASRVGSASISGGQRQRISLARGCYDGGATLFLFDDVVSALDQRVAQHVLRYCLQGLLAGKTRIIVTNNPLIINAADRLALLVPVAEQSGEAPPLTGLPPSVGLDRGVSPRAVAPEASALPSAATVDRSISARAKHGKAPADAEQSSAGPHTVIAGPVAELLQHPASGQLLTQLVNGGGAGVSIDDLQLELAPAAAISPALPRADAMQAIWGTTASAEAPAPLSSGAAAIGVASPTTRSEGFGSAHTSHGVLTQPADAGAAAEAYAGGVVVPPPSAILRGVSQSSGTLAGSSGRASPVAAPRAPSPSHAFAGRLAAPRGLGGQPVEDAGHWGEAASRAGSVDEQVGEAGEDDAVEGGDASVGAHASSPALSTAVVLADGRAGSTTAAPLEVPTRSAAVDAGLNKDAVVAAAPHHDAGQPLQGRKSNAGDSSNRLPFMANWIMGAGGPWFAVAVTLFLLLEAAAVEVGVWWLSKWSEDPDYASLSLSAYAWLYALFVVVEQLAAFTRQHIYIAGTVKASDALHRGLLFRLTHAPVRFFDSHSTGSLVQWFTRDLAELDTQTFYASEYFWLGLLYSSLIVIVQITVSAWVLVPMVVVLVIMWLTMREGAGDDEQKAARPGAELNAEAPETVQSAAKPPEALATSSSSAFSTPLAPETSGTNPAAVTPGTSLSPAVPVPAAPRRLGDLIVAETRLKGPLMDHFAASLEGLSSIRAFAAEERFRAHMAALLEAHTEAQLAVAGAQSLRVLRGNLIGALYYIASVALIVPLRAQSTPAITPGAAGFIIVNSCFSSTMVNLIIEHASELQALAHARSRLLGHVMDTPQEELWSTMEAQTAERLPPAAPAGATATPGREAPPSSKASVAVDDSGVPASLLWGEPGEAEVSTGLVRAFGPYARKMHADKAHRRTLKQQRCLSLAQPPAPMTDDAPSTLPGIRVTVPSLAGATPIPQRVLPASDWPARGGITLRNLQLRYSPHGPLVLKGIDLDIPGGCHVGLCGRTGSGKSSVLAALTRLVEPCGGSALIDGVDISAVPLHTLRSRLTVISQDPLFFSGTLRRNLDPFGEFSDGDLTEVLRQVGLYDFAVAQAGGGATIAAPPAACEVTPSGAADSALGAPASSPGVAACAAEAAAAVPGASLLDIPIAERGSNLSAGEQQLLAAARAWLRRPRVCLCDEMSSNLDVVAEEQLQRTLRASFAGATVVQIAHRLVSVIESHLVVVLSDGLVEEAGCPWDLLQQDTRTTPPPPAAAASTATAAPRHGASFRCTGLFANMVAAMPPAQRKELHERARQAFLRDGEWMRANMPHLLASRVPHS